MQIDISFRHMEPSDTLRDYADEKIRRVIRKHIRDDFDAQITLGVEKSRHIAKLHLVYKGISVKCEESSEDMYKSIDLALDKFERQIHRYKDKIRTHKDRSGAAKTLDVAVVAVPEVEEVEDVDAVEEAAAPAAEAAKVIKHEKLTVVEMSISDAVMKMDLENLPVVVFINEETKATSVLYKQEDGSRAMITVD